jgi:hypothetical protein
MDAPKGHSGIRRRLREQQQTEPPIEFAFKLRDRWSHRLLVALLRRYQIRPYRYRGQRYTTIMALVGEALYANRFLQDQQQDDKPAKVVVADEVTSL